MVATLTDDEARQVADQVLQDEAMLPAAVLKYLALGRQDLAAVRQKEAEERRAKQEAEDREWAEEFQPLQTAALAVVPEDLDDHIEYQEAELRRVHFAYPGARPGHYRCPQWTEATVLLACPGCDPVRLQFTRGGESGRWLPWVFKGYYAHPWDADRQGLQPGPVPAYPTLPLALAVAREAWLAKRKHEADVPL